MRARGHDGSGAVTGTLQWTDRSGATGETSPPGRGGDKRISQHREGKGWHAPAGIDSKTSMGNDIE